jgi:hypothetical protein
MRWMFLHHPDMAKRWAKHTPNIEDLPEKADDDGVTEEMEEELETSQSGIESFPLFTDNLDDSVGRGNPKLTKDGRIIQGRDIMKGERFVNEKSSLGPIKIWGSSNFKLKMPEFASKAKKVEIKQVAAAHVGMNDNFLEFTKEELEKSVSSMKGVPIVINKTGTAEDDHAINSSLNTVGWTTNAYFDGYTLWVDGEITDPDVIPKLVRETSNGKREINYVSMGAEIVPICSICGKDIRTCGHERGKEYNGKLCKVYASETKFNHLALTNFPADKNATIGLVQVAASSLRKYKPISKLKENAEIGNVDSGIPAPATTPRGYNLTVGPGITVEQYALAHQREHEALNAKIADISAKIDKVIEVLDEIIEEGEDLEEGENMAKSKEKAFVGDVGGDTTSPEMYKKTIEIPTKQDERYEEESEDEITPEELQKKLEQIEEDEEEARRKLYSLAKAKKKLFKAAKKLAKSEESDEEEEDEEEEARKKSFKASRKIAKSAKKMKAEEDEEEEEEAVSVSPAIDIPKPGEKAPIERPEVVEYPGGIAAEEEEDEEEEARKMYWRAVKKLKALAAKKMAKEEDEEESEDEEFGDEEEAHVMDFKVTTPEQYQKTITLRSGSAYAEDAEKKQLLERIEKLETQRKMELAARISEITGKPAREFATKPLNEVEAIWDAVKDSKITSKHSETAVSKVPEFAISSDEELETPEDRIRKYGVAGALKYAWEKSTKKTF